MKMAETNKKIKIFYFCLIAGSASFLFFQMQKERLASQLAMAQIDQPMNRVEAKTQQKTALAQNPPAIVKKTDTFPLDIGAEAALSILIPSQDKDLSQSKILFKKNADKKLPIASISKLMSAAVAIDIYSLDDQITISREALSAEGDGGLNLGEKLTVNDLLYIMLIESSNDAAEALAGKIGRAEFIALMNEKAQTLGMENTSFISPNGLDPYDQSLLPNTSSAFDLARLITHIQNNYPLITRILSLKNFSLISPDGQFSHYLVNTNVLLYQPKTVWGKTGYTKKANGCIVNIIKPKENDGHLIVNVILGASDRFYEMQRMADWVDNSYIWQ